MDPDQMSRIAGGQATVADKIRALSAAGVPRAEIARFLGKRYQHVRNVLEGDAQSGGYVVDRADLSGVRDNAAVHHGEADGDVERRGKGAFWLRVRPDGALPIPEELAEALNARPGKRVFARLEGEELKVVSADTAMERARALVRRVIPRGVSLVDSLLADRRAEAARELEDD